DSRTYVYLISNRTTRPGLLNRRISWQCRPLDIGRMAEAAAHLKGQHDFSAFRAAGCQAKHAVRSVMRLDITRHDENVLLLVEANAFLQHMVRNIAGVLMAIGIGDKEPSWAGEVLAARDRRLAGVTASPYGLYFLQARYPAHFGLPESALQLPLLM